MWGSLVNGLDTPVSTGGESNLSLSEVESRYVGQSHTYKHLMIRISLRLFPRVSFIKGDGAVFVQIYFGRVFNLLIIETEQDYSLSTSKSFPCGEMIKLEV